MPRNDPTFQNQQAVGDLLRGMNSMQAQAGLMPGNVPPTIQSQQFQHASQTSEKLRVEFQQQAQLSQMVTPSPPMGSVTPQRRPTGLEQSFMMFPPDLPQAQLGSGTMMARQRAIGAENENLAMLQAGTGLGMRTASQVGVGALAPFGGGAVLGMEHFGLGQKIQDFGSSLVTPIVRQRERALQLQSQSLGTVVQGGDLSATGQGLSASASSKLSTSLMGMAEDKEFKAATKNMFNRQDVMKITKLADDFGMLDQSQDVQQIQSSIKKISKSVSNFMTVMEQPDLREAMRAMGRMRELGMTMPEASQAAQDARMFARMAGTTPEGVMNAGMQAVPEFRRRGLSGASGQTAGMAAQGFANQAAAGMDPRTLSRVGGKQGIAQAFSGAAASAGTIDAILPALVGMKNGELAVDNTALNKFMSGETGLSEMMRQGASNMRRFGARGMIQEFSTRKGELQDEIQRQLSGPMQLMMPMMMARGISEEMNIDMGAAIRVMGKRGIVGEQQARALEHAIQDPEFFEGIRQQIEVQQEEEARFRRVENERVQELADRSGARRYVERGAGRLGRRVRATVGRIGDVFAEDQDIAESAAQRGGVGRAVRRDRYGSDITDARVRDRLRNPEERAQIYRESASVLKDVQGRIREEEEDATSIGARLGIVGPHGFGFSEASRGGEFERYRVAEYDTIFGQIGERIGYYDRSAEEVQARSEEIQRAGRAFEDADRRSRKAKVELRKKVDEGLLGNKSQEDAERIRTRAGAAVNKYMESLQGFFVDGSYSEAEMKEKVRSSLVDQGIATPEEAAKLVNNKQFMDSALTAGKGSRSEDAEAQIKKIQEGGGNLFRGDAAQIKDLTREEVEGRRERILEGLGVNTGMFSGVTDSQRKAVLQSMGGKGAEGKGLRKVTAAKALRERASRTDDEEEKARLMNKAARLEREVEEELGVDKTEDISRQADALIENMGDDALNQLGERFSEGDINTTKGFLRQAGKEAGEAASAAVAVALTENVGADAAAAIGEGGGSIENTAEVLSRMDADKIKNKKVRELVKEGKHKEAAKALQREVENTAGKGGHGAEASGEGGFLQRTGAAFQKTLETLGIVEESAAESRDSGKTPETPGSFEEAVPMFSEASSKLLKAAEALDGQSSVVGIGNILNAGNPLAGGFTPLSGILDNFFGDE